MRITTAELKTGWLHPRRVVRNVVATHFVDARTTDPDVTAHAIRGAREFGWQRFLTWGHSFAGLPLADAGALEWVCGEAERSDGGAPSDNLKGHLAKMLTRAEITLLERHQSRILSLASLRPRDRQALRMRLELAVCPPAEAWRRLEDHCRMAASGEMFADARITEAELLLEPLERAGDESVARVMDVLRSPPPKCGGDDPHDWLTGLMIVLAGRLRIEEAAPRIWDLLVMAQDWYGDEAEAALTSIGTPGVVRLVGSRYPEARWGARLCATTLLTRVRCDESVAAIEEALGGEDDDLLRGFLGLAAAAQFDDRLVTLARQVLEEAPEDPDRGDIRELLVAFSHLSGWELPERDDWEQEIGAFDDRISRLGDPAESPRAGFFPHPDDDDDFAADDLDVSHREDDDQTFGDQTFGQPLQRAARVGRNAPCPCGSGKKYKRCCMGDDPGPE